MSVSNEDVPALIHLAVRLRKETFGCSEWDVAGVTTYVTRMRDSGWPLAIALEQILRRATDKDTKTPGALMHRAPASARMPSEKDPEKFRPPTAGEACPRCGGWCPRGTCVRDRFVAEDDPVLDPSDLRGVEAFKAARRQMKTPAPFDGPGDDLEPVGSGEESS